MNKNVLLIISVDFFLVFPPAFWAPPLSSGGPSGGRAPHFENKHWLYKLMIELKAQSLSASGPKDTLTFVYYDHHVGCL